IVIIMTIAPFKYIRKLIICLTGLLILFIALLLDLPDKNFHLYFLDVGQGDSIFIKTPENHQILIDGGPKNYVLEELNDIMPYFDKSIDLIVLTHPHADHIEGLLVVLKHFKVDSVLITGMSYQNKSYMEFLRLINKKNIPVFYANSMQDFIFSDTYFDILYPFHSIEGEKFSNINNSSIVMKIYYKKFSLLLTGDSEEEVEEKLINQNLNLSSDMLKLGHHGSRTASTRNFLLMVDPITVIIQCGSDNKFNHPHLETLKKLFELDFRNIYRTDTNGRIEFTF
ncbi:MBL fold metallo-hydrolase, partial [Candidatus Peregrinibacteria bacterium]|nr:MBL fold metallo-hydrolase [Candidatus Peregrinibacteria bacterium]